ncbi:hypothetical protein CBR_g74578 [Chara braunii]|uniref:Uncharacterized protein n=1 Tax=Chara braunii TaxID=69332 RepID=A0A388JJD9_CHABU|nr:hypothetical protein CBR_g74578 [Chara braunii]|eukprot:GBG41604.1 hypothetical protein CBR_g74578 [Chara braunii]
MRGRIGVAKRRRSMERRGEERRGEESSRRRVGSCRRGVQRVQRRLGGCAGKCNGGLLALLWRNGVVSNYLDFVLGMDYSHDPVELSFEGRRTDGGFVRILISALDLSSRARSTFAA